MLNHLLEASIRIVFSSLMSVPLILFGYFMFHFYPNTDCFSDYLKHTNAAVAHPIAWPDNGLLTIAFDSHFFSKNRKAILALMHQYQFAGVLSLSKHQSCRAQALSMNELLKLEKQGWEITVLQKPLHKNKMPDTLKQISFDDDNINDMPSPDVTKQKIYDMTFYNKALNYQKAFINSLEKTKTRNGWMMLYFHTSKQAKIKNPITIAQLDQVLKVVKYSHIPVVLQEQVVRVSQ